MEDGLLNYKHLLAYNGEPEEFAKEGDKLGRDLSTDGKPGKFMTHKDVGR